MQYKPFSLTKMVVSGQSFTQDAFEEFCASFPYIQSLEQEGSLLEKIVFSLLNHAFLSGETDIYEFFQTSDCENKLKEYYVNAFDPYKHDQNYYEKFLAELSKNQLIKIVCGLFQDKDNISNCLSELSEKLNICIILHQNFKVLKDKSSNLWTQSKFGDEIECDSELNLLFIKNNNSIRTLYPQSYDQYRRELFYKYELMKKGELYITDWEEKKLMNKINYDLYYQQQILLQAPVEQLVLSLPIRLQIYNEQTQSITNIQKDLEQKLQNLLK